MATTSSAIFTGSSTYSKDFQNVILRATGIASLPITQLKTDEATLTAQSKALTTIDDTFAKVQTAVDAISAALDGSSFDAAVSNSDVASVTLGEGAREGNYSILVKDVGAYSNAMTSAWNAPTGSPHAYHLQIGSDAYDVNPTDNSAASVASTINSKYGDKVHAVVVNVGPNDVPEYRISLQSVKLGTGEIDLKDGTTSVRDTHSAGRLATYQLNGSGRDVSSDTRDVNVADGVFASIKTSSATAVNMTVTRSSSALSDALVGFAGVYNDAVAALDAQNGQSGGALQGQAVISQISHVLRGMATYSSGGSISGMKDLGMELQTDGTLQFNPLKLMATDLTNSAGISSFFGSTDGSGFLKNATDAMASLEDTSIGLIKTTASSLQTQISGLDDRINQKQAAVDALQLRLQDQMAAVDAMIASMQQQYSYMSSMFQAMSNSSQQY